MICTLFHCHYDLLVYFVLFHIYHLFVKNEDAQPMAATVKRSRKSEKFGTTAKPHCSVPERNLKLFALKIVRQLLQLLSGSLNTRHMKVTSYLLCIYGQPMCVCG